MPQPWRYRHTQFGTVIVGSLAASALFLMGLGVALGNRVFIVGGPVMMGVAALLFYALTVEIDATHLIFRFGVGLIHKRIPLAEIVAVKPVRNSWLYGWGIHCTPHGWLYNVSGWDAVERSRWLRANACGWAPTNRSDWRRRCWRRSRSGIEGCFHDGKSGEGSRLR